MSVEITVEPATERDIPGILAIYNHAVLHTTASWDYDAQTLEYRTKWFHELRTGNYPILVARADPRIRDGPVLGVAWLSPFRPKAGFQHSAENSVYVSPEAQGRGVGRALLRATLIEARKMGLHVVVSGMDGTNTASLNMHSKEGFVEVGRMPQVGQKFGRWLDLIFMQITLPSDPAT